MDLGWSFFRLLLACSGNNVGVIDEQASVTQLHGVYGSFCVSIILLSDIKRCQC